MKSISKSPVDAMLIAGHRESSTDARSSVLPQRNDHRPMKVLTASLWLGVWEDSVGGLRDVVEGVGILIRRDGLLSFVQC